MTASWVPGADAGDFTIANLPWGVFSRSRGGDDPRACVRIGDFALDLRAVAGAGLIPDVDPALFASADLDAFAGAGARVWRATREAVAALLSAGDDRIQDAVPDALVPIGECTLHAPVAPGDYVDFYSSIEHASNLGKMFRPDAEPLLPNWRHLPVGYHGRASSVVVSGTPIVRPCGQRATPDGPTFGPSAKLDFELEIGFVYGGAPNRIGEPVPIADAEAHIFGVVLVNDWSARDIQAWEYVPLGPFLGKSFATSISPWVVPLDALRPFFVEPPPQEPAPMPHLRRPAHDWTLDLDLHVLLAPKDEEPAVLSSVNARSLYWTMAQQLAHATSNGAVARPGDLFASGTISGAQPGTEGSLIELSWNGTRPVVAGGQRRAFLEDFDTVVLRGRCGPGVGFGEVSGTILPAANTG